MKSNTTLIGQSIYWLSWPMLWLILKGTTRTRVLILNDDRVLVVKNRIGEGKWSLPGGGIKKNESLVDGAIREVKEETGIKLLNSQLIKLESSKSLTHKLKFNLESYYVNLGSKIKPNPRLVEIAQCSWINIDKLNYMNASENTLTVLRQWQQKH